MVDFRRLGGPRLTVGLAMVLCCAAGAAPGTAKVRPNTAAAAEQAVVDELSLARTKPQEYAKFLEDYRRKIQKDGTAIVRGAHIRTKEGVKAVDEAIAFLKKVRPLTPLTASRGLALAASDHVKDTGPRGLTGHSGTDGSTFGDRIARHGRIHRTAGENISYGPDDARSIVMQLIVDDGVPGRGHRTNIFNPDFRTVGVAIGDHQVYGRMCVMDFADAVTETKRR